MATIQENEASRAEWWRRLSQLAADHNMSVGGEKDPELCVMAMCEHAAWTEHERFLAGEHMTLMVGPGVVTLADLAKAKDLSEAQRKQLRRKREEEIDALKRDLNPTEHTLEQRAWVRNYVKSQKGEEALKSHDASCVEFTERLRKRLMELEQEEANDSKPL